MQQYVGNERQQNYEEPKAAQAAAKSWWQSDQNPKIFIWIFMQKPKPSGRRSLNTILQALKLNRFVIMKTKESTDTTFR